MDDLAQLARVLGVAPAEVSHHLVALPSWEAKAGRSSGPRVRVTALVRTWRGLRAVVVEAETEADALAALARGER